MSSPNPILTRLARFLSRVFLPQGNLLKDLRASWGKPGSKDDWLVSRYFELTSTPSAAQFVDDKTWKDLEFPKLFQVLNATVTPIGAQTLFRKLRSYVGDPAALARLHAGYQELRDNSLLREKLQIALTGLKADSNALLANHVFGETLTRPKYSQLIALQGLLSVGTLAAVLLSSLQLKVWLAVAGANAIITLLFLPRLHRNVEILITCNRLMRVADALARSAPPDSTVAQLPRLVAETSSRSGARRAFRWFWLTRMNPVAETLATWLNLLFLTDFMAYVRNIDNFTRLRPVIASTFELVGSLDADIAIASFLEHSSGHCQPAISSTAMIDLEEAWHPLIASPVKVSICLNGRSALVTGSNMAGKTTFIKTVGISIILARTLGFCPASRAVVPHTAVMASIRGEHSVESGKSHYFAEIEAIKAFFIHAQTGECGVFLIDELFSGTNTVERLAAARAVLETLSEEAQVLVTTHDVELQESLSGHFDLYHFLENPDVDGYFDYRLRTGATTERNAIRLLGRMGFPEDVVRKALTYSRLGSKP